MSRPQIIVVAITLAKPGGATSFALGFAKWLKDHGANVTMVAGEGDWLFDECQKSGLPIVRVPSLVRDIKMGSDLRAYFELRQIFRDLKPDAIHLNSSKMGVLGSLAARGLQWTVEGGVTPPLRKPRIVYCIGGWAFLESGSWLKKMTYRVAERITGPCKDRIVCVHPGDKQAAERAGIKPKEGIEVVPNGVDYSFIKSHLLTRLDARRELDLDQEACVFGTIANFYPAKNLPAYLDACRIVADRLPHARFVLIGDGPERKNIEDRLHALKLEDRMTLAGSKTDAWRLLKAFDAFVLPSTKEGMSLSLLEAMAAGRPCVATDVGANAWMLGDDAGWIVPNDDRVRARHALPQLAETMIDVAEHQEEAARRGAIAECKTRDQFPLEETYRGNAEAILFS